MVDSTYMVFSYNKSEGTAKVGNWDNESPYFKYGDYKFPWLSVDLTCLHGIMPMTRVLVQTDFLALCKQYQATKNEAKYLFQYRSVSFWTYTPIFPSTMVNGDMLLSLRTRDGTILNLRKSV